MSKLTCGCSNISYQYFIEGEIINEGGKMDWGGSHNYSRANLFGVLAVLKPVGDYNLSFKDSKIMIRNLF